VPGLLFFFSPSFLFIFSLANEPTIYKGVFFNYEISPMLVIHTETRQSLAHFLTDTCAIVGGVLTVAGVIDSLLHGARERLQKGTGGEEGLGFAAREGKWL
jgi:hypothetical protein